ncbi:MAG: TolC family protein [Phycisphaerae bacterium]|nr:TolC family protein [Phycisphaerae bacterium]
MTLDRTAGAFRTGSRPAKRSRAATHSHCVSTLLTICSLSFSGLSGCALTPSGTKEEQARMHEAGKPYEEPFAQRAQPELPASPSWQDVLQRAFLANGDLEASYFEWKAAVQRIEMASAYPNSNVQLGYSYMFSSERMKTFDRQTFSLGFDPSMNLSFPTKVQQKGQVALDEARTTAERFRTAKFDLQRRVLSSWADLQMLEQRRRIQQEQLSLGHLTIDATRARAQAGGVQRDLLRAEASLRTLENNVQNTDAELTAMRAMLNGMLARGPNAPLAAATADVREIAATDDQILAVAVERNPEIAALAHQVQGRTDALELARMQWIPDINPSFMFTGSVSQAVGATIMLPTTIAEIKGGIREAEAMLRSGDAMLRQTRSDRAATLVATLVALRNNERQAALFETTLLPLAERVLTNMRQSYASGAAMYLDLIEAQNMLLDTRLMIVEARASREKRLAELEALMGTDIETVVPSSAVTPSSSALHMLPAR